MLELYYCSYFLFSDPTGIRTRISWVKTKPPEPLVRWGQITDNGLIEPNTIGHHPWD